MRRQSPQTITYADLVKMAEEWAASYARQHETLKGIGAANLSTATKKLESAKQLVRMLKRCEPGKQVDMFQLFQQTP